MDKDRKMIELFDRDKKEFSRKSSKGNQLKWENDGIWYKADYTGYEGLAEYVVSHLLMKSSLKDSEYVLYDQGAGLLADTTMDYPLAGNVYELMDKVQSKTVCQDFDEQLELAEKLYGITITFTFDKKYVDEILKNAYGYEKVIIDRVRAVIFEQMRRYKYLFTK